jgi:EAL domain-containing protein (putative c-di-GMP-specific phosphodiesterase class I)
VVPFPSLMSGSPLTPVPSLRDTRRAFIAPVLGGVGRLYLWFPDLPSQSKVVRYLTTQGFPYQLADGNCVLVDAEWERLRDVAIPLRRVLTQYESDDTRVLFKSDGGDLTTADFPRVHSFTHFSLASQTSFLHDLLDGRRLTTVYQPIVLASQPSEVFALEALLRGVSRQSAVLYPAYLLEVARACGMLAHVDHAARAATVAAMLSGEVSGRVFINISPLTAHDPVEAVDSTLAALRRAQIPPQRIVFEVTEADHALDTDTLRRALESYRAAGFGVALDDVGAGYSSLNLLHQLRPDYIKLDMELIRNVHADGYKALIAQKILEIARSLGVHTVAEGVETAEELAWVQDHGADYVQGYLIARPGEPRFPAAA